MKLVSLDKPKKPENSDIVFGVSIPPIKRLKTFSDEEFEEMVTEWAYDYLQHKYVSVYRHGGAGDKGRDVVGFLDEQGMRIDIYQCKHYDSPLAPSQYWIEFGKLCYYTYIKDYVIPQNYYVVASQGVGQKLKGYIDNPKSINIDLVENWDKYCKTNITDTKEISLDEPFITYIKNFDFSIVRYIDPIVLIDQYSETKWYKYRFGGGLKKRPKAKKPPETIEEDESKLLYIKELLKAYSEYTNGKIDNLENLKSASMLYNHFARQREDYYSAQSLKRFSRDEFVDEPYEDAKDEVYRGVIDTSLRRYDNGFVRLNDTLSEARKIPLDIVELGQVLPSDKCGMCHELVNEEKLKWVNLNEEY
ncbi:ABC-three component system protein [uncultured Clostridium sp.]|uniref:ABC-three component system protein n=1 Tax=uncultured Clostridium sp. TaxID=59620 RepID=UPI00258BA41D|nr:ABC-three component system protein [uncultured Clostridium sp.]MDU1350601.1 ABC-three component system protein [Clostridium argentinense]